MKFIPIAKITPSQAVILETALSEGAVRWGAHATLANTRRRDAVFRLQRAGMLVRVEPDPSVIMQWTLTDAGRTALEDFRTRRQAPAQTVHQAADAA